MKKLWQGFKKVMAAIGRFQSNLILIILYFVVFLPLHLYGTVFADYLDKKGRKGWWEKEGKLDEEWLRRQF